MARCAVIDIGKTNAKVLVVDLANGAEEVVLRTPNPVLRQSPYPHHDADALWSFVLAGLARVGPVDAISVTTHGASGALVGDRGELVLPLLDYEYPGPDELGAIYGAIRPDFAETGSPRLPLGLNLGAQLFWQARSFPEAFGQVRHILTLPQYWSFRLTGVAASEATSLGCHTDLWNPFAGDFSTMVERLGWRKFFPPVRGPGAVLGPILPEVADATGLPAGTPVLSGIHDSNASLVPWLDRDGARTILSTGTWMIVMALRGERTTLDQQRDLLVNVNARGEPVPTARFMAGREIEELTGGSLATPSPADEAAVLASGIMALPSLHPGTGPFPGLAFRWKPSPPESPQAIAAGASFYAALMASECMALIGAAGDTIVEGPFAGNPAFLRMLATATQRPVTGAGAGAGTGLGAALLHGPLACERRLPPPVEPQSDAAWRDYVAEWRALVGEAWRARG